LPLTTGSAAAGGMWVAPGSHVLGPIGHTRSPATFSEYAGPVSETIPAESRPLDLALGQVVVLHSELLHRTGPNETDIDRVSYQCGFASASTRFLDDGLPADHKLPVFRSLTESAV
jgi:ectoine hydroxylase-related dioxygenase (phytanoyl-CoA dioxygenase family)